MTWHREPDAPEDRHLRGCPADSEAFGPCTCAEELEYFAEREAEAKVDRARDRWVSDD